MTKIILGLWIVALSPAAAQAQTGKHVAVGASFGLQNYRDGDFKQSGNVSFLYRLSQTGHAVNGWTLVPAATLGYARADFSPDVGGSTVRLGQLRAIPALVGFGPQYRQGRTQVSLSVQAGASFNSFAVNPSGRAVYQDRLGAELEDIDTKTSFAAQAGANIWYDLNSRLGLYGGVSYLRNRPKAQVTTTGVTTEQRWDADYVGFSVGAAIGLF